MSAILEAGRGLRGLQLVSQLHQVRASRPRDSHRCDRASEKEG